MNASASPPFADQPEADAEYCAMHEAIVGAFGLPPGQQFASIRGDPSLRETVALRPR